MTRHMSKALLLAGAALVGAAGVALPMAAQAQAYINVQIGPPPPPRHEVVPAARPGYVWAPGHYQWVHNNYVWRRGHWVAERPGYAYVPPTWVADGPRWAYQPERWDARPVYSPPPRRNGNGNGNGYGPGGRWRGDRDGDGVPNRHDRRPNNPHRY